MHDTSTSLARDLVQECGRSIAIATVLSAVLQERSWSSARQGWRLLWAVLRA